MQQDRAAVSERLMQIFSVALMTALLPDMFKMVLGEDFAVNIDKQKEYIQKSSIPLCNGTFSGIAESIYANNNHYSQKKWGAK
jgi:hypothetical protein